MNKLRKATAGLLALIVSAASIGAVSADAYGIIDAPQSELEYELSARIVSDTRIEVVLEVTNNPGINAISFALRYSANCTPVNIGIGNQVDFITKYQFNTNERYVFSGSSSLIDGDSTQTYMLTYRFDVANAETAVCEFSSSVVGYTSLAEGISFNNTTSGYSSYEFEDTIETEWDGVGTKYIIGDMNNSGNIDIGDVSDAYRFVDMCKKNSITSVNTLSSCISLGVVVPFDINAQFPDLLCAEVADADRNGYIEDADSEEIFQYYVDMGSSLPLDAYIVGKSGEDDYLKTLTISAAD